MARMIPPVCAADTTQGEKRVFGLFQNDPDTKDWVVFHSYGISRHATKRAAEIDMVVLVPELGILCIEIKGSTVSRRNGIWDYGYKTSSEGPFRQASSAMHALKKSIARQNPFCRDILFWSCVIFTSQTFQENSPEWHSWQSIDGQDLSRNPISRIVKVILNKAHNLSSSLQGASRWYDEKTSRPTAEQIDGLIRVMRGDFEAISNPRDMLRQTEQIIEKLTEEQFSILDSLEENERIRVTGLAGTGKTMLAIEAARRASMSGSSVLFVCFNKLLSEWIAAEVSVFEEDLKGGILVRNLHGLMRSIVGNETDVGSGNEYWRKELPEQALLNLWSSESPLKYDVLIVDEAQDILFDEYLDVLNEILVGGLAGGKWLIFGDFENQTIYKGNSELTPEGMVHNLNQRSPHHVKHKLYVNCRNAERIATTLTIVCGLHPGYIRTIQDIEGAEVVPKFWKDDAEQQEMLFTMLQRLRLEYKFKNQEIVVLSTRNDVQSCAAKLSERGDIDLRPLRSKSTTQDVSYASIHSFKGLEAMTVIVTDIMNLGDEQRSLLYVAMSRARVRLILLMHKNCHAEYKDLLLKNLK